MYQWWPYIYEILNKKADLYMNSVNKELQAIADKQLENKFYKKSKKRSYNDIFKFMITKIKRSLGK